MNFFQPSFKLAEVSVGHLALHVGSKQLSAHGLRVACIPEVFGQSLRDEDIRTSWTTCPIGTLDLGRVSA